MKRLGVKRGDLARVLAERSRLTGRELTPRELTLAQAQDEVDRVVHAIVTRLRQGQRAEMPGVGTMTAKAAEQNVRGGPARFSRKKATEVANKRTGQPKS
jgi:nucleoid DNA-binding protein